MAEFTILKTINDDDAHVDDHHELYDRVHHHHPFKRNSDSSGTAVHVVATKVFIPPEILIEIFQYLDRDSLVRISCVNSGFQDNSRKSILWKLLLQKDWRLLRVNSNNDSLQQDTSDRDTDQNEFELVPQSEINHDSIMGNSPKDLARACHDEQNYYETYQQRYSQYKIWRNSIAFIYEEERNQYINRINSSSQPYLKSYLRYLMSYPILYIRLLKFLFISPQEQPDYGLANEVEYIKQKALSAGGSLLLLITFMPVIFSTLIAGIYPSNPILTLIHMILQLTLIIMYGMSHLYNKMDKSISSYPQPNYLYSLVAITAFITLVLMRYVDDLLSCSLVVFQISIALGLATSLNHMISNTEDIDELFGNNAGPNTAPPFVTCMILANLVSLVVVVGGFKAVLLTIILIAIFTGGSTGGDIGEILKLIDFRTIVFIIVAGLSVFVFFLAKNNVGGNFKKKRAVRQSVAILLLVLLILSFMTLFWRLVAIQSGSQVRWELSFFNIDYDADTGTTNVSQANASSTTA
ncbi:hypothetical protein C9374_001781 [Naegleria lovaniensis]|uniref:F-box domain-containing protein n=1 Tax=Naegleria lovaniensis TaxID=51637 RepID=A0AA88GWL1_NAELO|nr:uncharacterized protein C9374_001781 [Naegleria lovaniensis]KAG2387449.1 hypothetical protein C9374_001781 [Naegleria lovaniensis]